MVGTYLSIDIENKYSEEFGSLLDMGLAEGNYPLPSYFNAESSYLIIREHHKPIGLMRLNFEASSVYHYWTDGTFPIALNSNAVELSNTVIIPEKRQLGIYKIMLLEALCSAVKKKFKFAVAGIDVDSFLSPFLIGLGFIKIGEPLYIKSKKHFLQPIAMDLEARPTAIRNSYTIYRKALLKKDIYITSKNTLCSE